MKRHELLKHLKEHGCLLLREGGRHSVFWNPVNGNTSAVPRHTEIADLLASKICKDLAIPAPK
jgi:mRNA interferase HicA